MRKAITIFLLAFQLKVLGQSEASNYITYDTTIALVNASSVQGGTYPYPYKLRITRQVDYFQRIASDTTKRERIFLFMPGAGEVQTGNPSDSAFFSLYGFHYWLQHGYNGGILLGNGTHYPIWITYLQPGSNTRPWFTLGLLRRLNTIFQPRNGKFDVAGLSQGSYEWGCALWYSNNTTGDHETMSLIESWVDLEGVNPESFQTSGSPLDQTSPAVWSTWVNTYGGHFFGLDGTSVSVGDQWTALVNPMNTAKAGTAYFAFQNYGGGGHCCWNSMYDPSVTNFRSIPTITNANIITSGQNTMGNYTVDPTTGTNIFQWMMRQGDTTLITSNTVPSINIPVGSRVILH